MVSTAKATITVDDKVVSFEGPQEFVDAQVARYMRIDDPSNSHRDTNDNLAAVELSAKSGITEKQLVAEKQPRGHSETVAVLAFALAEAGAKEFTEDEMRRAYIRANVRPPKVIGQAIRDAKNNFDYVERGKKRGTYKLSNHGDRTVRFDMPIHNEKKG